MSKYRDREGNTINVGDVVAAAVTMNQQTYAPFAFVVTIVKKVKGRLILDGVFTTSELKDRPAKQLQKLHGGVDLRKLNSDWLVEFRER